MCQRLSRKKNRERVKVSENENGTPGRSQDLAYGETGKVVTDSKATEVVKEDGVQLSRMPKETFTYFFFNSASVSQLVCPEIGKSSVVSLFW